MSKVNFDSLDAAGKKAAIAVAKGNGTTVTIDGEITAINDELAKFDKNYSTSIKSASMVSNNKGELVFVLNLVKPAKFLSNLTGNMEDLNNLHVAPSNLLTDLGIISKVNPFEDLDLDDDAHLIKTVTRLLKRVTLEVDVTIGERDGTFNSISDYVITGDGSRLKDAMVALFPESNDGLLDN